MNKNELKQTFSNNLRKLLQKRFPKIKSDNGFGFELLKHFNKEEAALCSNSTDRAQAARRYVNWIQGRALPDCFDLAELCVFLKCDSAYLLGQQAEIDRNICAASKLMGISETAVERIRAYPDWIKICICDMVFDPDNDLLIKLLSNVVYYVSYSGGYFSWAKFSDSEPKQIKQYMSEHLLKSAILDSISKILDLSKKHCEQTACFAESRHFIETHKVYDYE